MATDPCSCATLALDLELVEERPRPAQGACFLVASAASPRRDRHGREKRGGFLFLAPGEQSGVISAAHVS